MKTKGKYRMGQLIASQSDAARIEGKTASTPPGGTPAPVPSAPACDPIHDFGMARGGQ